MSVAQAARQLLRVESDPHAREVVFALLNECAALQSALRECLRTELTATDRRAVILAALGRSHERDTWEG